MKKNLKILMELKNKIDEAEKQENILKGEINSLNDQRKRLLGCSNLDEIENKLKQLKGNLSSIDNKIEKGMEELEEYSIFKEYFED